MANMFPVATDLRERLRDAGVEPPPLGASDEVWRRCLADLCGRYLGPQHQPGKKDDDDDSPLPLPEEIQYAALQMRVESSRHRNFELKRQLDVLAQREAQADMIAQKDPIINARSLNDFVCCLESARKSFAEAAAEAGISDVTMGQPHEVGDTSLGEFLDKIEAWQQSHAPVSNR
eukprot:TRINITY_DN98564_c0_g1_i1.p1 TRINITY_DN98564_c0_g1~~TRINITY_DN98564_c0_g1_i1.p1  ORF type:complete len:175 (+),score=34.74 TRINITY_DN98564_c0_g1_i1:76-600(+)